MRLLDRYILRELLVPLSYCLGGFLIFWMSFDLFSEMGMYQELKLTPGEIARIYFFKAPDLLVVVLPITLLLALLYALSNHARYHEITAIRAAGVGLWRTALPYFGVGALFSLLLFALNEHVVPDGMEQIEMILTKRQNLALTPDIRANVHFRNARDQRFWSIASYNLKTGEMTDPQVEWVLPSGVVRKIFAKRGEPADAGWVFHDVQAFAYDRTRNFEDTAGRIQTNILVMPEFTETPEQIKIQVKFNKLSTIEASKKPRLSLYEINYLRTHLMLNPKDRAKLETQYHARLSQPWTCVVVVLIALPFGAASGRRNIFVGVASSIFICFAFFVLMRFGLALGTGGYLTPWIAAWLPNFVFGAIGLWLTAKVR
ncbi:MAG: LptF/LptG family permease [Verrucomicrobiota bacterium]|nr:LptF/LptG family permease [Verrucomicrobiota bacterium]